MSIHSSDSHTPKITSSFPSQLLLPFEFINEIFILYLKLAHNILTVLLPEQIVFLL